MVTEKEAREKIIVPLDFSTREEALGVVDTLKGNVGYYKIGLQLFTALGRDIVKEIKDLGHNVFLDLKFHDIPNTTVKAVLEACSLGVDMMTVHASAGSKTLALISSEVKAFAEKTGGSKPVLLGVTVLTSSSQAELDELNIGSDVEGQVRTLALLSKNNGFDGVVSSPHEIAMIKELCGRGFINVVPGVRPEWAEVNDQVRIATPRETVAKGADYLVIGRPIIKHKDPLRAVELIVGEIIG